MMGKSLQFAIGSSRRHRGHGAQRQRNQGLAKLPVRRLGFEWLEDRRLLTTLVNVVYKITDVAETTQVSSLNVGGDYKLQVYVQDAQGGALGGVFQAYFDLSFPPILSFPTSLSDGQYHGTVFTASTHGTGSPATGQMLDVGGLTPARASSPGDSFLLLDVPIHVTSAGTGTFSISGDLVHGQNASTDTVQMWDSLGAVPLDGINFTGPAPGGGPISVASNQVIPNPTTVVDANAGTAGFTLTTAFTQSMDTSINPTISFPTSNEDPTADGTLTLNTAPTNTKWTDDHTYVAAYNVVDHNLNMPNIDVQVSGAKDASNNPVASFTAADVFSVDMQNPTVTINQAAGQADPTNASPIDFSVVFSEVVTDFATGDVTLSGTAGATTAVVTDTGDHMHYDVVVSGMTGSGTVTASLAAGVAHDAVGNANSASTSTDNTVNYDVTAPTVTINQAASQADPTNASPIHFTVVFSKVVTDFATGDVTLSGTAGATTATVTGTGTTYDVAVSGMTGSGTVIASLAAGVAHDAAGNANTPSTSTDNTVSYSVTAPTVTINQAAGQADPTNASPIHFSVIFSEVVTDFATGDVTLSGTAGATTAVVTGSGTTYNVAVSGMTGSGTVIASLAAGVAHDAAGNANMASTSTDNSVTYDVTVPTVTINQAAGQADPTNASPINFGVVFSEVVTDFATGDVTLSGTAAATTALVTDTGDHMHYNVAVSGMAHDGTVIASLAAGVAHDAAGNASVASTSTDNTVTYDTTAPTVTINQAAGQADPTNTSPINFGVVFSEVVTDFATGDVTLSGTAAATTAAVTDTGDHMHYNVAVSGMAHDGTVIASLAAGVAHDAAGNASGASTSTDNSVTYDTTAPTVTINQAASQADPTNASPIHFTVVFSQVVTDFATGDVTLSGTAAATTAVVTGSGTTYDVAVSGMTHDGTVIANLAAGVAHDAAGNASVASTSTDNTVTLDTTAPTVTINQAAGQADPTNTSPINFSVVFSEVVTDFATGDVTLSGTAGATTAVVTGSGTTYNVAVSGMTHDGTVIASLAAGVAHDAAGNASVASTSTDNTVTYDTTAPTVTINQAAGQADPTNASPIHFTVIFSEVVTDFATGDVTLGGTAGATTAVVSGSGTTYDVAVSGMAHDGTVIASLAAAVAHDAAGNGSAASTSTDNTVNYHATAPTVTINQATGQADPTNASPINFTVVFSEAVADFTTGDVTLGGTAGATTATVTGSGTTYNVAVSGMTGEGTVIASLAAGVAHDAAGNASVASTSTDNTVTYFTHGLTLTITPGANPTNASPINFTVVFGETVTDFDTTDVAVSGTAGATTAVVSGSGTTYDVTVTGMTADGTVTITLPAGAAHDGAGIPSDVATSTVNYDTIAPTVTINQAAGQADPTNASPINFSAVFSEVVTDFATGDVTLSGTAGATTALVTDTGDHMHYNVAVSGMTHDGTVIASLAAGVAHDAAGNASVASTSADNTVTYDTTAPTVTINQAASQADPTNASPIHFTVVFAEVVTDFATGDVTLGGTAGATTAVVTGSGTAYDVAVSGMTHDGTVIASLAAGVAHDAAGNASVASTSTDNTVTYDTTAPTVTINQAASQVDPTNASPINFSVVFSEVVTDFATGDVTLSGTAGATTAMVTDTGDHMHYDVAVSGMTHDGTVIASLAAGVAHDAAGNASVASTSTDNTVTYDTTAPTVTINQAASQADPTNALPIHFTVVFSQVVTDFATGDVTLSGTAGATTAVVSGSGTTYDVAVSGMTGNGTVMASLAAGVAHDAAGNASVASTSTDNTVTYDTTAPTVTINQAAGQADPTNTSPIHFTVVFSEVVTDFATGDVTLSGTAGATTAVVSGSGTTYDVAVSGMTGSGTVMASLAAAVAHDAAGNASVASTSTDNAVTYDTIAPTVTINQATGQADPTNTSPINFSVVFSEVVTDFATGDVTLSGTAGATTAVVTDTGDHLNYNVVVSGMTGNGTVTASLSAGVAHDAAGNANTASTSTDNTVTYSVTAPTVTINQAASQADPTNTSPIHFTVVFSEAVTDFATGDVTLSGTAGATTAVVSGSGTTYDVAVSGMTQNGTVIASLAAAVAHDAAGNASAASTSTDNSVTYDTIAPTVTINQATGQADPTSASPINFSVVFSEVVTDFATGDVTFTGTAPGTLVGTVTGSGTTYNVAVTGMNGNGTVIASLAAGVAHDAAGNANTASTSTDNTVTYVQAANASLAGIVYIDADNDGQDAIVNGQRFHAAIPDVTITLTGTDTSGGAVNQICLTASDGSYYFGKLAPGTYALQETPPMKYLAGTDTLGTVAGTASGSVGTASFSGIVVGAGQKGVEYNFGHRGLSLPYVSDNLFLSSTPSPEDVVRQLDEPPDVELNGAAGTNFAATLPASGGPVAIVNTTAATLTHADDGWLGSLTVTITNQKDGSSETLDATLPASNSRITKAYANGILTLTGPDTAADYEQVLRTVVYSDTETAPDPTPRIISFVAYDTIRNSNTATTTVTFPQSTASSSVAGVAAADDPLASSLGTSLDKSTLVDQVLKSATDWLNP